MCGIGGILRITPPGKAARTALERTPFDAVPEAWLDVLDESIRHRGPDGQGRFRDRAVRADGAVVDVALVHRRLSIIDHGGGAQPMLSQRADGTPRAPSVSERVAAPGFRPLVFLGRPDAPVHYEPLPDVTDTVAVVFNGCIYNHRRLRSELQALGHTFASDHSDTEVLLHGWREWKERLGEHLDGMFGLALWERRNGTLAMFRDRFGEKPLHLMHVHRGGAWLNVFSSVPMAGGPLAAAIGESDVPVRPLSTWRHWLRFGWSVDQPVKGAGVLQPGLGMVYSPDGLPLQEGAPTPRLYRFGLPNDWVRSRDLNADETERLLSDAVRERLEADVPLGCFLSGGVDSSLVALMALRHAGRLQTFTVRMPDPVYDEAVFAEEAARHLGCDHTTLECVAKPAEDLVRLIQQIGQPFGDSSLLPAYWVSRAASRHVKVALSGDGGDELFAGYERYTEIPWWALTAPGLSTLGLRLTRAAGPKSIRSKMARLLDAAAHDGYGDVISIFPYSMLRELVINGAAVEQERFPSYARGFSAQSAIHFDLLNYLPEDLMRKTDSASMAVALEVRAPFLDLQLSNAATNATLGSLMPHNQRKGLLRQVARRHLPAHIVDRPKMGFAIPIGEWFRSDYGGLRMLLLDHLHSTEPFGPPSLGIDLNMAYVRRMLDEHLGTGPSGLVKRDHSQRLYMLLVL